MKMDEKELKNVFEKIEESIKNYELKDIFRLKKNNIIQLSEYNFSWASERFNQKGDDDFSELLLRNLVYDEKIKKLLKE